MQNEENIETLDTQPITEATEETVETPTDEATVDWKGEALKYKAMLLRQKKNKPQLVEKAVPDEIFKDVQELKLERAKREFGFTNGLSPEETDFVFRFDSKNPAEGMKNPFVKNGIDSLRAQKKSESGTLSPSSRAPKLSQEDFTKMSKEDRQKSFENRLKGIRV